MKISASVTLAVSAAIVMSIQPVSVSGQPPAREGLCWRSITPDVGVQNLNLIISKASLASSRRGEVWLASSEDRPRILKWNAGHWAEVPANVKGDPLWNPIVVVSPDGQALVATLSNRDDYSMVMHVARAKGQSWDWLGEPLVSSPQPFTHVQEPSFAFLAGERPVVAWSEELDAELIGLFVASWNGTGWTRLGTVNAKAWREAGQISFEPRIVVDSKQQVWLAWLEHNRFRVVRWDGAAWRDVGPESLDKLNADEAWVVSRELSFAVDTKGHAWVLRVSNKTFPGGELAFAHWDGTNWVALPGPRAPVGRESTVWSAEMILHNDAPTIAWSQADGSDNHSVFVSEWVGGRWVAKSSGSEGIEGTLNAMNVRLKTSAAESLVISWDDLGKNGQMTRAVVQSYLRPVVSCRDKRATSRRSKLVSKQRPATEEVL